MMKIATSLSAIAAVLMLASCQQNTETAGDFKAIDKANMDTTTSPGENFFWYANGGWLANNEIPESETRWGSFDLLRENNLNSLHTILDETLEAKDAEEGSAAQKVGDLYKSGMDTTTIDEAGIKPIQDKLDRIDAIADAKGLLKEIATLRTEGLSQVFGFTFHPMIKM